MQNGLRGRLIGDNKLCLAVLSDPRFADLFTPADYTRVQAAIPWSRNIATCDAATLRTIRDRPEDYVLKRPLDTRGRGVVIGREATDWADAVNTALVERWLVQEYCSTTVLPVDSGGLRHDLTLGAVNGRLASVFARVGTEERLNIARSSRPHPVFL
ncbi:hypothetical protein [Actinophytocola oryzae]|uniref:ATP-grasp domain-containing protein n=1 Tax=Actinophytocola oryzae TaxID=502181 RepID=A0A4R7W5G3_9PSEU|nr:hypothetical protein [Actinophytocola oryzae]TDV57485.1 hypothetical protein CLV71_101356 [Actinophytocola oryzae]